MNSKEYSINQKRISHGSRCRLAMGVLFLLTALWMSMLSAQAETTPQKLFRVWIRDNYTKQKVDIYAFTAEDGTVTYGAAEGADTITLNAASDTFQVKVTGKSAYFKNLKLSVSYANKFSVKKTRKVKLTLRDSKGTKVASFRLTVVRPQKPIIDSIQLSKDTFAPGRETLTGTVAFTSQLPVKAYMRILNSSGKIVYKSSVVSDTENPVSFTWDGKPSAGNGAGLDPASPVSDGTYTMRVYLKYPYGKKSKTVNYSTTFKTNAELLTAGEHANVGNEWPWTMYITGDDELDYMLEVICQKVLKPEMSEIARARALYEWIGTTFSYHSVTIAYYKSLPVKMSMSSKAAKANIKTYGQKLTYLDYIGKTVKLEQNNWYKSINLSYSAYITWVKWGLKTDVGECRIIADVYMALLGHAGIKADVMEHPTTASAGHHFWNVVQIGGAYYMADADRPVQSDGNMENYLYFLRGTSFTSDSPLYGVIVNNKYYNASQALMSARDCARRKTG